MTAARPLSLAVLGDSIAYGQGAARSADTVGARLAAALGDAGTPIAFTVHAVPGARSAALAGQVRAATTTQLDLAVIIIGANDVTHLVPVDQAAERLAAAVRTLRAHGVRVVVAPAPDLSAVPLVPPQFRDLARSVSASLRRAQTRAAVREGARVAVVEDALRDAFAADVRLFSADRFHPSSAGYAVIAEALLPAVQAAANDVVDGRRHSA
ncbi:SGNH/GDSL hydrolase family protein [uncultured Jatrophihabitans sp.]|uniref:SGNH/GDSL hydrolase family protein n=1 Tax=uncultured Jatrophihabitans sp. TaxID=1610747 RepID=UPI0035CA35FF